MESFRYAFMNAKLEASWSKKASISQSFAPMIQYLAKNFNTSAAEKTFK